MDEKKDGAPVNPNLLDEKVPIGSKPGQHEEIGVSKDGMRVHPQPTADPLDPLNWSSLKKHTVLAIVMYL